MRVNSFHQKYEEIYSVIRLLVQVSYISYVLFSMTEPGLISGFYKSITINRWSSLGAKTWTAKLMGLMFGTMRLLKGFMCRDIFV